MEIQGNLGLELRVKGIHGVAPPDMDPSRVHYTMEIQGNLGLELRVKGGHGVAPHEMDSLQSMEIQGNLGLELGVMGIQCSDRGASPLHPTAPRGRPPGGPSRAAPRLTHI